MGTVTLDACPSLKHGMPDNTKYLPFDEATYQSLIVLAENYRSAGPPRIRMCLHCLMAALNMNPPPQIRVQLHIQIGMMLLRYTEDLQPAQLHLQTAVNVSRPSNGVQYLESMSMLAEVLCKNCQVPQAKSILHEAITSSQGNVYWHARLLLQLARLHYSEGDHMSARQLLDVGLEQATNCGSDYLRILFLLSKGMVLLVEENLEEVNIVLTMCGQLIDSMKGASSVQAESHKVYFLTLQVAHLLSGGQVKSVKSSLKQLQQSVQEMTAMPALPHDRMSTVPGELMEVHEAKSWVEKLYHTDSLCWLPRDQMCILVYLVTVTYSVLAGYLDKAQKYTEKALKQIKRLKMSPRDDHQLLIRLELMFLEHMAQCHLVMCDRKAALNKIIKACRLCVDNSSIPSVASHTTQMHTLLGMYCISMNYLELAERHLQLALKMSDNNEQLLTNMLNLAMVFMHNYQQCSGRVPQNECRELVQILSQVNPDSSTIRCRNLKAASFFIKGMFSFFQSSYNDAKRYLRETLKMANAQDLNRLTACALVLLGHIYLSVGNHQESVNMVLPAMQLAGKIPDMSVKLWASALLCDLFRLCGDERQFAKYRKMYEDLASWLLSNRYDDPALGKHKLLQWLQDGLPPPSLLTDIPVAEKSGNEAENMEDSDPMCSVGLGAWSLQQEYGPSTDNMNFYAGDPVMAIHDTPHSSKVTVAGVSSLPGQAIAAPSKMHSQQPPDIHHTERYFYPPSREQQPVSHAVADKIIQQPHQSNFNVAAQSSGGFLLPFTTGISAEPAGRQNYIAANIGANMMLSHSDRQQSAPHGHPQMQQNVKERDHADRPGNVAPVNSFGNPFLALETALPQRAHAGQLLRQRVADENLQVFEDTPPATQQAWAAGSNQYFTENYPYPWR